MATYKFTWRDGTVTIGSGYSSADALTKLGFGQGAVRALDYWHELHEEAQAPIASATATHEATP